MIINVIDKEMESVHQISGVGEGTTCRFCNMFLDQFTAAEFCDACPECRASYNDWVREIELEEAGDI